MFKHIVSNWSLNLLQILVMLVLAPLLVEKLGEDGYGIWVAIIAATFFLELLSMGVPMASVRHISEAVAAKDQGQVNRLVSTGLGVTIGLAICGLVLGTFLFLPFESKLLGNESWAETSEETLSAARVAYFITVFRVAAGLALRFPIAVFDSHRDFVAKNMVMASGILFRAAAVIVLLYTKPSLIGLAWIFIAESVGVFLLFRILIHRRHGAVRFGLACFDRSLVKPIMGFGFAAAVLNVGSLIAFQLDSLVIGVFLHEGPKAITIFDLGNKFFAPLATLMFGVGTVILPTVISLKATGEDDALEQVLFKWSKICLSVVLPVCLYLTILGPRFLAAWIGPEFELTSGPITRILAPSFVIFLPVHAVALPILMGTGRPGPVAGVYLAFSLLNLALSIALVKLGYGLIGVALGTAIPNVLFAGYLLLVSCAQLQLSVRKWLGYVVVRVAIGTIPALLFLLFLEHVVDVRGLPMLIASGVAMLFIFAGTWYGFVYRGDPYLDLREELAIRLRPNR